MLKIFTKHCGGVVAINPIHVVSVVEHKLNVVVTMSTGNEYILNENFDFVIESLVL